MLDAGCRDSIGPSGDPSRDGWVGIPKSEIRNPNSIPAVALHFPPEVTMPHSLTLGAHLLLWVFPLVLAVLVVIESLIPTRRREARS
jgi:hypothetical protein